MYNLVEMENFFQGGAVAIDLATRGDKKHKIWCLILENTFTSIPDMASLIGCKFLEYLPLIFYKNKVRHRDSWIMMKNWKRNWWNKDKKIFTVHVAAQNPIVDGTDALPLGVGGHPCSTRNDGRSLRPLQKSMEAYYSNCRWDAQRDVERARLLSEYRIFSHRTTSESSASWKLKSLANRRHIEKNNDECHNSDRWNTMKNIYFLFIIPIINERTFLFFWSIQFFNGKENFALCYKK